jgi:hypothetical protein
MTEMQTLNISSISGIVLATLFAVEIIKRLTNGVKILQKIPVFVYSIFVAAGLTVLANKVLTTDEGLPLLVGNLWKLMWAAVVGAAASSGFYSWLRPQSVEESMKTPSHIGGATSEEQLVNQSKIDDIVKLILILIIPIFVLGCGSCPEKVILRDSMDAYTQTIREQHLAWSQLLTADPATGKNHAADITALTPEQYQQVVKTHQEYNELVAEDRQRDKPIFPWSSQ